MSCSFQQQQQEHQRQEQHQPQCPSVGSTADGPILSLRMKSLRSSPPAERGCTFHSDPSDRIQVMMMQEESPTYKCRDYMTRRSNNNDRNINIHTFTSSSSSSSSRSQRPASILSPSPSSSLTLGIDFLCREKMCEWSYRVVDHFCASREIVAIAIDYLDRFVDQCACDRTAFKLAAMTSVYMATKLFNSREISISSLAELSRGEFDLTHICEMEQIVLQTLKWRVHPPTIQCFIHEFHALLPRHYPGCSNPTITYYGMPSPVTRAIYQRAIFFAELALFDYSFVTQPRSAMAVACLLNAMEGMDESVVSLMHHHDFIQAVQRCCGSYWTHSRDAIEAIRNRLWYVYSQSAQYQEDEILPSNPGNGDDVSCGDTSKTDHTGGDQSPVCVSVVSTQ